VGLVSIASGATLRGLSPEAAVTIVSVRWLAANAVTFTCRDPVGRVAEEIFCRREPDHRYDLKAALDAAHVYYSPEQVGKRAGGGAGW